MNVPTLVKTVVWFPQCLGEHLRFKRRLALSLHYTTDVNDIAPNSVQISHNFKVLYSWAARTWPKTLLAILRDQLINNSSNSSRNALYQKKTQLYPVRCCHLRLRLAKLVLDNCSVVNRANGNSPCHWGIVCLINVSDVLYVCWFNE